MAVLVKRWECDECSYNSPSERDVEDHERAFKHHHALKCRNGDHDACLEAQLAVGKQEVPRGK